MGSRIRLEDVPQVDEWMSLPEAGDSLGVSRQQVHRMAASGRFETLSRVGTYLVVASQEVLSMQSSRALDS